MPTGNSNRNGEDRHSLPGLCPVIEESSHTSLAPDHCAAEEPATTYQARGESALPERYDIDVITLMFQGPFTLYCYWEITPETVAGCCCSPCGGDGYVLRVHPSGDDHFEVEVNGSAGSNYVNLERGGGTYFVELGLRSADGGFISLVRSNSVVLPPACVCAAEDENWLGTDELYSQFAHDSSRPDGSSPRSFRVNSFSSLDLSSACLIRKKGR